MFYMFPRFPCTFDTCPTFSCVYGNLSFVLVHEGSWFPRGAQTKNQKRHRPRNGQKRTVLSNLNIGIEVLDPNINLREFASNSRHPDHRRKKPGSSPLDKNDTTSAENRKTRKSRQRNGTRNFVPVETRRSFLRG